MDPYQNQRNTGYKPNNANFTDSTSGTSGGEQSPDHAHRDEPDSGTPQATGRQPQYSGGFTVIPPNESRRNQILTTAQKEEEALQRWKEANRVPSVHVNPERLGGSATLTGAREKQLSDLRCSKLQKKLKKEALDKKKRQEEEEEYQKMKDIQRKKAELLEEKRQQEEQRRREQHRQDHVRKTESFLQRFERTAPGPLASSSAAHTSSRSEAVESNQREEKKGVRDVEQDHRRVNQAFLDNLEGRGSRSEDGTNMGGVRECSFLASENFGHQPSNPAGQQLPPAHLNPDPDQSFVADWTDEADPHYDWALMKLMSIFPDCSKAFLEDILDQCNNDYEQAYTLLNCTMN
ncbi:epithelial-stromal interaction protein 1 [Anoplopoma fimbria]|uniref:epithelial-stromal interaction protein 1 n=1 Tax=Anoplopoma fimbria TaxID=229290 RepID=UPI0023EC5C5A|nr:epithelial-stromal interaction protein 1 [Anoplopoma fimbria]